MGDAAPAKSGCHGVRERDRQSRDAMDRPVWQRKPCLCRLRQRDVSLCHSVSCRGGGCQFRPAGRVASTAGFGGCAEPAGLQWRCFHSHWVFDPAVGESGPTQRHQLERPARHHVGDDRWLWPALQFRRIDSGLHGWHHRTAAQLGSRGKRGKYGHLRRKLRRNLRLAHPVGLAEWNRSQRERRKGQFCRHRHAAQAGQHGQLRTLHHRLSG